MLGSRGAWKRRCNKDSFVLADCAHLRQAHCRKQDAHESLRKGELMSWFAGRSYLQAGACHAYAGLCGVHESL